jgi:hypothetical protein
MHSMQQHHAAASRSSITREFLKTVFSIWLLVAANLLYGPPFTGGN